MRGVWRAVGDGLLGNGDQGETKSASIHRWFERIVVRPRREYSAEWFGRGANSLPPTHFDQTAAGDRCHQRFTEEKRSSVGYSLRNASIGSVRAARRAGKYAAASVTNTSRRTTAAKVSGSFAEIPKSSAE